MRAEAKENFLRALSTNQLARYAPYPKQREFHAAGKTADERLFMAGNQLGKTWCGGAETAIHLTGRYPDWWDGAVFEKETRAWCGGVSGESIRDIVQKILFGPPQDKAMLGTGMIPAEAIKEVRPARGVADLMDSAVIRHGGGGDVQPGQSIVLLKSYEKGREKWQGDTVDFVWYDEEPPQKIYSEGRTRTNKGQRGRFTFMTFTPLKGMSEVVRSFLTPKRVAQMLEEAA